MAVEQNEFKLLKKEMRIFYNEWRKVVTYCPALNTNIIVSMKGWNHITGIPGYRRLETDVRRRLYLLPYAQALIETATSFQIKEKQDKKYFALEATVSCTYKGIDLPSKKVRVVLIEDKQGRKIFYSLMTIGRHKK